MTFALQILKRSWIWSLESSQNESLVCSYKTQTTLKLSKWQKIWCLMSANSEAKRKRLSPSSNFNLILSIESLKYWISTVAQTHDQSQHNNICIKSFVLAFLLLFFHCESLVSGITFKHNWRLCWCVLFLYVKIVLIQLPTWVKDIGLLCAFINLGRIYFYT